MKRLLKWFWPPLVFLLALALLVLSCWRQLDHDIPLNVAAWQSQAAANAAKPQTRGHRIADTNTKTVARAQVKAAVLQKQHGIGLLTIPSVNVHLTIYGEMTNLMLSTGVGRYFPQRVMGQGNNVYAAHNLNGAHTLLKPIGALHHGALIEQTDFKHVYYYRVIYNRVIKMTEVAVLKQTTERRITLIRCEGPYHTHYRRVVIGRLTKVTPYQVKTAAPTTASRQPRAAKLTLWLLAPWVRWAILVIFASLLALAFYGYTKPAKRQRH